MESLRSMAIRAAANQNDLVKRFGRVQSLEIDPDSKSIFISALLKGEAEPIQATLHYELGEYAEGKRLRILSIDASREWLKQVATLALEKSGPLQIPLQGTMGNIVSLLL